jgi:hypothetical protein
LLHCRWRCRKQSSKELNAPRTDWFDRALAWLLPVAAATAQQDAEPTYSRLNTWSSFGEYSNDSSHILLGTALNRKIGAIGFQYQRRLIHRRLFDMSYTAEIRPGMLESDPIFIGTTTSMTPPQTYTVSYALNACRPSNMTYNTPPNSYTIVITCSRRSVVEQGFSPAGLRIGLMPQHRLQPTFSSYGGYMFSSQQVPIPNAGSFNFTFEFGAGLELYGTHERSLRLEYQVQHFSNKQSAQFNPGVDSGFIKLTYAFGR